MSAPQSVSPESIQAAFLEHGFGIVLWMVPEGLARGVAELLRRL